VFAGCSFRAMFFFNPRLPLYQSCLGGDVCYSLTRVSPTRPHDFHLAVIEGYLPVCQKLH
jgi:hypothetical protein